MKQPIEKVATEVAQYIAEYTGNLFVVEVGEMTSAASILQTIKDKFPHEDMSEVQLLKAEWLNARFTEAELLAHNIFAEGETGEMLENWESDIIVTGNFKFTGRAETTGYCKIVLLQNASFRYTANGAYHLEVYALGSNALHVELYNNCSADIYQGIDANSNIWACHTAAIQLQTSGRSTAAVNIENVGRLCCAAHNNSHIELTAQGASNCHVRLCDEALAIIKREPLANVVVEPAADYSGEYLTGTIKTDAVKL